MKETLAFVFYEEGELTLPENLAERLCQADPLGEIWPLVSEIRIWIESQVGQKGAVLVKAPLHLQTGILEIFFYDTRCVVYLGPRRETKGSAFKVPWFTSVRYCPY